MKPLLATLVLVAVALLAARRRQPVPCEHRWYHSPVAYTPPICLRCGMLADWREGSWQEPDDGVQADDYPWRVLARGAG